MPAFLEERYRRKHLNCVRHITLDPKGHGVVRIHMIPPRQDAADAPFLLLLNGDKLVPLNLSWAILLANFMDRLEPFAGLEISESDWRAMAASAVAETRKTYPFTSKTRLAGDLELMLTSLVAIARGQEPAVEVGTLSLGEYAAEMTAPHRMDLMLSAMRRSGEWHCNQKCLHCYAAGQSLADAPELSTQQWLDILRRLREANIPQVTFTGGFGTRYVFVNHLWYPAGPDGRPRPGSKGTKRRPRPPRSGGSGFGGGSRGGGFGGGGFGGGSHCACASSCACACACACAGGGRAGCSAKNLYGAVKLDETLSEKLDA